jgi:hypothetical protein
MPSSSPDGIAWTRQGLVLAPRPGQAHWASHAQVPTVLEISERCWRVYFWARDAANRSQIFYADLDPGADFALLHLEDRPLLPPSAPGHFDANGTGGAAALRVGAQVWLYYSGFSLRADVPHQIAIGLAVSDDGGHSFRRAFDGPVIGIGPHDPYFVSTPCLWRDGDRFRALYSSVGRWARDESRWECFYDLHEAESADGVHWQGLPQPALALAEGEAGLARPWVLRDGTEYRMWFCHRGLQGFRAEGGQNYRLRSAWSADGRHWQRADGDLAWTNPPHAGDWDGWMQAYPCVVPRGDEWIMFYNGNDFGRGGFGWARAPRGGPPAVRPAVDRRSGLRSAASGMQREIR